MHERSIFQLLRLFLSFEMIFQHHDLGLTKFHAGSEQLQYWCVPSLTTLITRPSKTTTQLIMHLGNAECRLEGSKLLFKILLADSYLLHMSTKRTGN